MFPPGSVTGAPKVQALHVISELEATGREVYTGAIGFASPHAGLELSVAIRTFEARDGRLWLGAGGGIVAGSDPEAELEECLVKARPLISAISGRVAALRATASGSARARSRSLASGGGRTRRSACSRRCACATACRCGSRRIWRGSRAASSSSTASGCRRSRSRTSTARCGSCSFPGKGCGSSRGRSTRRELPIVLTPYVLPGGLGEHKWVDRRLVDALGGTPLLLDADGTVLEAGWASVLVRRDGRLLTPRTDGRILPSTSRPDAEETDIRLQDGDELFLSSATSEVVPAVLAATSPEPPADTRRTPAPNWRLSVGSS